MSARLNLFWFLSLLAPAITMLSTTRARKKMTTRIGFFVSLILTYAFCLASVMRKWDLRQKTAVTPEQIEAAMADGANKVFTLYFIAPFEAVLWTVLWLYIGNWYWTRKRAATK